MGGPLRSFVLWLAACSSEAPPPPVAAPALGRAAAEAFCKVVQGARGACEAAEATAKVGERAITFRPIVEHQEEKLGVITLRGWLTVTLDGAEQPPLRTPIRAYGGNAGEALARGAHEWAVVYGVALADWILQDPLRPALRALSPDADSAGEAQWRGWTLQRGRAEPLDHLALQAALAPARQGWAPGLHALGIELQAELGRTEVVVLVDGQNRPELGPPVAAAFGGPVGTTLRQYYLFEVR